MASFMGLQNFLGNYRQNYGNGTNDINYRDANSGEKTGIQQVVFKNADGKTKALHLVVPERESIGYGNIEGWDKTMGDTSMHRTRDVLDYLSANSGPTLGDSAAFSVGALAYPGAVATDLIGSNMLENNFRKNELSTFYGKEQADKNKAVGMGSKGQDQGQVFGLIDENGNTLTADGAKKYISDLISRGYKLEAYEAPEFEQEHTGPAYVPGDLILGLLGLRPNRGSVGYKFDEPQNHAGFQQFISNLRNGR